jgi:hypothetical protein
MSTIKVMGSDGHSTLVFDPEVEEEVSAAHLEFDRLIAAGYRGATVTGPGQSEIVKKFDPHAEETIMLRPMAGGA